MAEALTFRLLGQGIAYSAFEALSLDLSRGNDALFVAGTHQGSVRINTGSGPPSAPVPGPKTSRHRPPVPKMNPRPFPPRMPPPTRPRRAADRDSGCRFPTSSRWRDR